MGFVLASVFAAVSPWMLDPPISVGDLNRFPADAELAKANWELARSHVNWVEASYLPDNIGAGFARPDLRTRYGDTWPTIWFRRAGHCCAAWDELDNAWRAVQWRTDKAVRGHLQGLRDIIGADAYRRGQMPPPVPYEFFQMR